ncbi:MAG: hypothetical protein WB918_05225, partial [Candidatus Sulfotelmatobacter sp.]
VHDGRYAEESDGQRVFRHESTGHHQTSKPHQHFRATKYALSPELDLSPIWDFFLIATVLH